MLMLMFATIQVHWGYLSHKHTNIDTLVTGISRCTGCSFSSFRCFDDRDCLSPLDWWLWTPWLAFCLLARPSTTPWPMKDNCHLSPPARDQGGLPSGWIARDGKKKNSQATPGRQYYSAHSSPENCTNFNKAEIFIFIQSFVMTPHVLASLFNII